MLASPLSYKWYSLVRQDLPRSDGARCETTDFMATDFDQFSNEWQEDPARGLAVVCGSIVSGGHPTAALRVDATASMASMRVMKGSVDGANEGSVVSRGPMKAAYARW